MNADSVNEAGLFYRVRRRLFSTPETGGPSLAFWALVALLNFITQSIFCRNFAPGEFGTLNTALGIVGLMSVPLLALNQAFTHYPERNHGADRQERIDVLRATMRPITERAAWTWGAISIPLLFFVLEPLLHLPRFSVLFFTLLTLFTALAGVVGKTVGQGGRSWWRWGWVLAAAALARVVLGTELAGLEPWAESGLGVVLIAGLITLGPALFPLETETAPETVNWRAVLDRDFLLYLGATFSVALGIFLFSSADRIVAQSWFGIATENNLGYVNWRAFDDYQAAGLLGRALLWGTQPLLWMLFVQRSRLSRTTAASLTFFWIYLGALFLGVVLLIVASQPLSHLFCGGDFQSTASLVPVFAVVMIPLGLLQGLGMFALASRRHPECFVLGGCGVGYTLVLYLAGRQPQLMTAYMFGGAVVALMVVLFVGVVRWGRRQP